MEEFRRDVQRHKPDSEYAWVHLGPIAGLPSWHQQSQPSAYPFPTNAAAALFASTHRELYPGREVEVVNVGLEP